jgi:hypothetical protein
MTILFLALLVCGAADPPLVWTPPENPDPWKILQEAKRDASEQRYDVALAKHVWYHERAETIDGPGNSYRLSMALYSWYELAKKYPPAMERLKRYRDRAIDRVMQGKDVSAAFQEFAEINRQLREHSRTSKTFRSLHAQDKKLAAAVFQPASQALIASGEYGLVGEYVNAKQWRINITDTYQTQLRMAESLPKYKDQRLRVAEDILAYQASMLVACLVIAGRADDAATAESALRKLSQSAKFQESLDKAINGQIPKPLGHARNS